jgi:hypothetical protein
MPGGLDRLSVVKADLSRLGSEVFGVAPNVGRVGRVGRDARNPQGFDTLPVIRRLAQDILARIDVIVLLVKNRRLGR